VKPVTQIHHTSLSPCGRDRCSATATDLRPGTVQIWYGSWVGVGERGGLKFGGLSYCPPGRGSAHEGAA
jgi:hypothetical protein